jgi:DNA-binding PadR family transcriptional regulator
VPHEVLSPVATLCLAILHRGEATGYEIKKESVEGDYRYFIDASYGSIYPALARLSADGYVTVREETQPGRPARKIYSITPTGRAALLDALSEPPGPDVFRARFLLVAKFAAELPADTVRAAIAERRAHLLTEIEHLRSFAEEAKEHPGAAWIVDYGLACMTASLAHLDARGEDLIALAQPSLANAAE